MFKKTLTICYPSQVALVVKNMPAKAGDMRDLNLIPGLRRSSREGHGNPFQCSCLENTMKRGTGSRPWGLKESDMTEAT